MQKRRGNLKQALALNREAVERWESSGYPLEAAEALVQVGRLARLTDDVADARQALAEAVRRATRTKDLPTTAQAATELGLLVAHAGDTEAGIRLLGYADRAAETAAVTLPEQEAEVEQLRSILDASTFERAWRRGREATLEALVEPLGLAG